MTSTHVSGQLIFRSLTEERGFEEITRDFDTLEALFQLILKTEPPLLVDRLSIRGVDEQSQARIIHFVFRSAQKS